MQIDKKDKFIYKKSIVVQIKFIIMAIFNTLYNFLPFFCFKKLVLSIMRIKIGKKSYIHSAKFFAFGKMEIGNNSTINRGCYLDNRGRIYVGNNVNIAHDTKIYTQGHDIDSPNFESKGADVIIEDYACIFSNVLIMPGVRIGKGAVVYPGSVITKNVGNYEVVGGNPAKYIKKRNENLVYELNYDYWFAL